MAESYKWLTLNKVVQRGSDGASIPNDSGNKDWQQFQADGGVAADADPPPSAAAILTDQRAGAITQLADTSSNAKLIRAILLVAMNEINLLRERDVDRTTDVAAATTLADLKTRWAARGPALTDRTAAQLKTAVQALINAGTAD